MYRACVLALVAMLATTYPSIAQEPKLTVTVTGGKEDAKNVPVCVPMELSGAWAKAIHCGLQSDKDVLWGQFTAPGITTENIPLKDKTRIRRDLHVILPLLKANSTMTLTLLPQSPPPDLAKQAFVWKDTKGEYEDLLHGSQPILRYMYKAYDNSSTANRDKTYKVFHHVFEPDGTRFITNGGDTDPANDVKRLYPHHRGLFFAFNKISATDEKGTKSPIRTRKASP